MSIQLRQHVPSFCSGVDPQSATIENAADLERIEWVRSWRQDRGFDHFAVARPDAGPLLMAVFDGGRPYYVVAFLSESIPELPVWRAPETARTLTPPTPSAIDPTASSTPQTAKI